MDSARRAPESGPAADALEFVRFCYQRRRVGWPELYDEMCAVAGKGLFRGWGPAELEAVGLGFTLFEMPRLAALASRVIAEEAATGPCDVVVRGARPRARVSSRVAGAGA